MNSFEVNGICAYERLDSQVCRSALQALAKTGITPVLPLRANALLDSTDCLSLTADSFDELWSALTQIGFSQASLQLSCDVLGGLWLALDTEYHTLSLSSDLGQLAKISDDWHHNALTFWTPFMHIVQATKPARFLVGCELWNTEVSLMAPTAPATFTPDPDQSFKNFAHAVRAELGHVDPHS